METYLYLKRLCKDILSDKFNERNYRDKKSYYGKDIQTMPLHSYSTYRIIGFSVIVYAEKQYDVQYDWETGELLINEKPYMDFINLLYLADNDINMVSDEPAWKSLPRSVELECYTDAGECMIINLEETSNDKLQEYINDFDINENILKWLAGEERGNGVPFTNINERYEDYEDYLVTNIIERYKDYEDYLEWLQKVCDKMPY